MSAVALVTLSLVIPTNNLATTNFVLFTARMLKELNDAKKQLAAMRWQVEHEGCAASHLGETTYECRADEPCGLCRLRSERDRLRAENEGFREVLTASAALLLAIDSGYAYIKNGTTYDKQSETATSALRAAIAKAKGGTS